MTFKNFSQNEKFIRILRVWRAPARTLQQACSAVDRGHGKRSFKLAVSMVSDYAWLHRQKIAIFAIANIAKINRSRIVLFIARRDASLKRKDTPFMGGNEAMR